MTNWPTPDCAEESMRESEARFRDYAENCLRSRANVSLDQYALSISAYERSEAISRSRPSSMRCSPAMRRSLTTRWQAGNSSGAKPNATCAT
jgi:hypothetical protein